MEAVKEGIFLAVGALVFCLAVSVFLYISSSVDRAAERVYDRSRLSTSIAYETENEPEYDSYQRDIRSLESWEFIGYLMSDHQDTDISFCQSYLCAEDMNIYTIKKLNLNKKAEYIKEYEYGTEGRISCLIIREKN